MGSSTISTRQKRARIEAQGSLIAFTQRQFPQYSPAAPHLKLAAKLEAVMRGEIKRLIVTFPPRHGKSELTSVRFPAYYLGNNPDNRLILCSYAADLALHFSGQARALLDDARWPFDVTLQKDTRSKTSWGIEGRRGGLISAGVGGPITGFGADIAIIDDPFKNSADAESPKMRDSVWAWYQSTFYTRLEKDAAIVIISCMTGDTPVLMASGDEKRLDEIRPGDSVATYDGGRLAAARVLARKAQGEDDIFELRTAGGNTVRANARHPFLVMKSGKLVWSRLGNIRVGDEIVRLPCPDTKKGNGVSGAECSADGKDVKPPQNAKASAKRITSRTGGPPVSGLHRLIQWHGERAKSSIATASRPPSSIRCCLNREGCAPSVSSLRSLKTGEMGYASTMTTASLPCVDFSATAVTSCSPTPSKTLPPCEPQQTTWNSMDASPSSFQLDEVVSITPAGRAIVYDVQIERTENFIANGLVSHNTRWHFDDLIGRLIDEQGRGGDKWEVVNFPAISDGGEALWPEKFDIPALQQIREVIGARAWSALYQQTPMLEEGAFFKREWFDVVDAAPIYLPWVRYWDLAASVKTSGDFTASAKCAIDEEGTLWIADVMRGKWEWPDAHKKMWSAFVAEKRNTYQVVEEALHGIAALQQLRREPELAGVSFRGWRVDRDKQQRAMPWAARAEAGKVKVLRGAWNAAFFEEIGQFPYGKHDDQVDAVSGAVAVISANVNKQRAGLRSIVISSKPDNWRPMAVRR